MRNFSIWSTVGESWTIVWRNPMAVLRAGWLLLPAAVLYQWTRLARTQLFASSDWVPHSVLTLGLITLVAAVIYFCASLFNLGGWMKFLDRHESRWGLSDRAFGPLFVSVLKMAGLFLLAILPIVAMVAAAAIFRRRGSELAFAVAVALVAAGVGVIFWAAIRLSLVYIHAVLTRSASIAASWRLTKNHFWRLTGLALALVLAYVGIAIVFMLLMAVLWMIVWMCLHFIGGNPATEALKLLAVVVTVVAWAWFTLIVQEWQLTCFNAAYLAIAPQPATGLQEFLSD